MSVGYPFDHSEPPTLLDRLVRVLGFHCWACCQYWWRDERQTWLPPS